MGRADGKRIDTWTIRNDGLEVPVEVRLIKGGGMYEKASRFVAICDKYDLSCQHADINELEKEITRLVKEHLPLDFHNTFSIRYENDAGYGNKTDEPLTNEKEYGDRDVFFSLAVDRFLVAKTDQTGKRGAKLVRKDDLKSRSQEYWFDGYTWDEDGIDVVLTETPELREELQAFLDLSKQIGDKLADKLAAILNKHGAGIKRPDPEKQDEDEEDEDADD